MQPCDPRVLRPSPPSREPAWIGLREPLPHAVPPFDLVSNLRQGTFSVLC